jgi:hypothetical protein
MAGDQAQRKARADRARAWMADEEESLTAARHESDRAALKMGIDPDVAWFHYVSRREHELQCRSAVLIEAMADVMEQIRGR